MAEHASTDRTAHCSACGRASDDGTDHAACARPYDPPRFCGGCGRRLDVQVFPTGVVATCRRCDGVHPARRPGRDG